MGIFKKKKEERRIRRELDWMSDDLLYHHIAYVYGIKELVWEECTEEEYDERYPTSWTFKDHGCVCQHGKWRFFRVVLGNFLHKLSPELTRYLEERKPYWYNELFKLKQKLYFNYENK